MGDHGDPFSAITDDLQRILASFIRQHRLPGVSAGLVLDGRLAWTGAAGVADVATGRRPDADTLYRIASVTKTFTATAIVRLRDEGLLRLDDPLVIHVPEFGAATNRFGPIEDVTLRRLLQHTSGLQGEDPSDDPRVWTLLTGAELVDALDRVRVVLPPGSAHKYSNTGYSLLGVVVERVSGMPYEAFLREALLDPLGMASTRAAPRGAQLERTAAGYKPWRDDPAPQPAVRIQTGRSLGAGGLWSTVEDLARWITEHMHIGDEPQRAPGRILARRSIAEMQWPAILVDRDWKEAQGLGWSIVRKDDARLVGHGGLTHGFKSAIRFSPPHGLGVITLFNGSRPGSQGLPWALLQRALPIARAAVRERHIAGSGAQDGEPRWRPLLGRYVDPDFADVVRIEVRDERLVAVEEPDGTVIALSPTDDPLVFIAGSGLGAGEPYRFLRGVDGTIDGMDMFGYPMVREDAPARPS